MFTLTADSLSGLSNSHSSHSLQNHSITLQHHQEAKPPFSLSYGDIMTAMTIRTASPTSANTNADGTEQFDQNTLINYVYYFIKNFIGASGTNTVAIDNKIEQAMDLVKSHLMFAVREEVEVLKEKISELMERITQLEHENTILRAHASQETLAQLTIAQPGTTTTASSKSTSNSNIANSNS